MAFSADQRGVLRGVVAGVVTTALALGLAIAATPPRWLPPRHFAGSVERALAWDVFVLACLFVGIATLGNHRFRTPEDIGGHALSTGTPRARALQGRLQNTLEQTVLAIGVHVAWAALMPRRLQAAIPAAVALFVIGRVLFFRGYERSAPARALGFALTFYPTVALLAGLLWRVVVGPLE